MILSRLGTALRDQNWLTVLVELLTIVIGIFLGLQADAWNQERLQRAQVDLQLDRIEEDVEFILQRTREQFDSLTERMQLLDQVFDVLDGQPLTEINRRDFERGLTLSYRRTTVDLAIPGLQALVESGNINLVADDSLRGAMLALVNYRRTRDQIQSHQLALWDINNAILLRYFSYRMEDPGTAERGPDFRLQYDLQPLRESEEFKTALGNAALMTGFVRDGLYGNLSRLEEIRDALKNRR